MTAILIATIGVTVVINDRLDARSGDAGDAQVIGSGGGPITSSTSPTSTTEPSSVKVTVTGSVTVTHVEETKLDPAVVPTPLTITADRGFGNGAELTAVDVGGARSTIVWDGGRPFVLSSGGALVLGPSTFDLVPEGIRVGLGGGTHHFTPGTYHLDTPVAVGSRGVARSLEAVTFDTYTGSTLTATGDAALLLAPTGARRFVGEGTVHLEGALTVTAGSSTRPVTAVDAKAGHAEITLTRAADGGWRIAATLEGEVSTR